MSDLNNLVGEMRIQLRQHQTELQRTAANIDSVTRNNLVIEKSMKDIKNTENEFVWESVGRTFVKISIPDYEIKLKNQIRENIESLNVLNKKKHYLETSIKNTVDSLKQVMAKA
jgi:prefoldin subunit 1